MVHKQICELRAFLFLLQVLLHLNKLKPVLSSLQTKPQSVKPITTLSNRHSEQSETQLTLLGTETQDRYILSVPNFIS